ncbi:MAG: hypothetical protein ACE5HT_06440 [Gemmatimonadales bacterium]
MTQPGADSNPIVVNEQEAHLVVQNDASSLRNRVTNYGGGQQLAIVPIANGAAPNAAPSTRGDDDEDDIRLLLVADVSAPVVNGITLQATHVVVRGDRALVSYNVQGAERAGGVDVFDVSHSGDVTLVSEALFSDTDVGALDLHERQLFLATSTSDPAFDSPAVLEVIRMEAGMLTDQTRRVDLPSFAGTGVAAHGNSVFVTSGTGGPLEGGLTSLDQNTLELNFFAEIVDARAVDIHGSEVVAMRGTPGKLLIFDTRSGALKRLFATGGANIPESKSTVQVARGLIFYAAGDEGLRVVDFKKGTIVAELPVPSIDGVDPADAVTNAASIHGNLVFLANGGAGLFVARANKDLDDDEGEDDNGSGGGKNKSFAIEILGRVEFPEGESANFAGGRGDLLFVATGRGGLKIIRIAKDKLNDDKGDDDDDSDDDNDNENDGN